MNQVAALEKPFRTETHSDPEHNLSHFSKFAAVRTLALATKSPPSTPLAAFGVFIFEVSGSATSVNIQFELHLWKKKKKRLFSASDLSRIVARLKKGGFRITALSETLHVLIMSIIFESDFHGFMRNYYTISW